MAWKIVLKLKMYIQKNIDLEDISEESEKQGNHEAEEEVVGKRLSPQWKNAKLN